MSDIYGIHSEKLRKQWKYNFDLDYDTTSLEKSLPPVKGPDFSRKLTLKSYLESLESVGFQSTRLGRAIRIAKEMRAKKHKIYLAFTSNLITSGLRDVIAYLCKNKLIAGICTTAGGIEEDVMKTIRPFLLTEFVVDDKLLNDQTLCRTGNIALTCRHYHDFQKVYKKVLEKLYTRQKKTGKVATPSDIARQLGLIVKDKSSFLYWAAKNSIPVFCPPATDGTLGDGMYFFRNQKGKHDFKVDIVDDFHRLVSSMSDGNDVSVISLGGSVPKHHLMMAAIYAGGAKSAIYLNTGTYLDGSNAGAEPTEALTWGKLQVKPSVHDNAVHVWADATITFPLLVAGAFT